MAKRKRYHGFAGLPSVSALTSRSASAGDILLGAAGGAAAGLGAKYALMTFLPATVTASFPAPVTNVLVGDYSSAFWAAAAGVAAYFIEKKSQKAFGHLVGALGAAAVLAVRKAGSDLTGGTLGDWGDIVQANLHGYGMLVSEKTPALNGYIVKDKGMSDLQAYAMIDADTGVDYGW